MPGHPDIHRVIDKKGPEKDGRVKSQNSWPIAMLTSRVCASVPSFMIPEWQIYFHTDPMFKEVVTVAGPMGKVGFK